MKVFRGYILCMRGNFHTIIMYCVVFFLVSLLMVQFSGDAGKGDWYIGQEVQIGVVNKEEGPWSQALTDYLRQRYVVKKMEDDKGKITEALYNQEVKYVLLIPREFQKDCLEGEEKLEVMSEPGSRWEYDVNSVVNGFVNSARVCIAAGYSENEAIEILRESSEIKAKVKVESPQGSDSMYNVFRFMPYLYFSILCFTMGVVRREYQKLDIRRRLMATSMPLRRQSLEMFLAFLTVGLGIWVLCQGMGIALCGGDFLESPNKWYILLNGFSIMLSALAASFFIGNVAKTSEAVNGLANVISLGFSFLGGVFIPLEMLTGTVKRIGQFFPTYWYSQNMGILCYNHELTASLRERLCQGILIQLAFGAACVAVAMAINKAKRQEE